MKRQPTPPELSDDELIALVTLSPAERADCAAMWRVDTVAQGRPLLDAPEYEGEDGG